MENLLKETLRRALRYLESLPARAVAPSPQAVERLKKLGGPLPEDGSDPLEVLKLLDEIGSPATVASAGPRYYGFVIGGSLPAALAANWLAAAWDQNAYGYVTSPVAAAVEEVALQWLADFLRLPPEIGGGFVTGATMANFSALAAARHALLERQGWDVGARGLFEAPPITVVVGEEVHASLLKALSLLGLGRDRVVRVSVDGQGRMRPDALPSLDDKTILCIQAGNVNTGAFDPAEPLCAAAKKAGTWVHVDGAFGLWARGSSNRDHLTGGLEQADSWAMDAHKWLNVPYDSGIVLVRQPQHLQAAMSISAAYLVKSDRREPYLFTPELSRRARGIEVWAALRSLGRRGLAELIERDCTYAVHMARGLQTAGYEVLNEVALNQVMVAFGDARATEKVIAAMQAEGTGWAGPTVWQGRTAMRISVSSWATTEEDVERSLSALLRVAAEVRRGG